MLKTVAMVLGEEKHYKIPGSSISNDTVSVNVELDEADKRFVDYTLNPDTFDLDFFFHPTMPN